MRAAAVMLVVLTLFCNGCDAVAGRQDPVPAAPVEQVFTPAANLQAQKGAHYVPLIDFTGPVDDRAAALAMVQLDLAAREGAEAVVIELNTKGGIVEVGLLLTKAIERSPIPVHCVVDGDAMSMGFYVLQGCATRTMTWRSVLMAHEPAISGVVGGGGKNWFKGLYDSVRSLALAMNRHQSKRMRVTYEQFCAQVDGKDWYMDAVEAQKVGAVDAVVDSVPALLDHLRAGGAWPAK